MALSGALVVFVLPPKTTARVAVLAMACEAPPTTAAFVAPVMVFDVPPPMWAEVQFVTGLLAPPVIEQWTEAFWTA